MRNLIFSPESGFYHDSGEWVGDPADATDVGLVDNPQEISGQDDAQLINSKLYTNESFGEIVERFVESLGEELEGDMIAYQASAIIGETVTYCEDSLWKHRSELLSWADLSPRIENAMMGMDREVLMAHYNDYCANQVYLDHNEGFIHQQVL